MDSKELSRIEEKLRHDDLSHDDCVLLIEEIKALKRKINSYEFYVESEQDGKYSQGVYMFSPSSDEKCILVPMSIGKNIERVKADNGQLLQNRDYTLTHSEKSDNMIIDFSNYIDKNILDEKDEETIYVYYSIWK